MSKKVLVAVLSALLLVLVMATGVLAAQSVDFNGSGNATNDYAATPGAQVYLPNAANPAQYRIHSNYTATTDACASCHAVHTGVGSSLLQWGTVYDTCMACHDGTVTTTYDVEGGHIANTGTRTSAGLFGTTGTSGSNHNVTGALSVFAAPGGPGVTGTEPAPNYSMPHGQQGEIASWDIEFGCQSCHSPHGQGGNARLLNPDVNGYAWAQYNAGKTKGVALQVYQGDLTTYTSDWNGDGVKDSWIIGYPYPSTVYVNNQKVSNVTFDNSAGFTVVKFTSAPASTPTADFAAGVSVKMTVDNYLTKDETVTHISGINTFCGACHVDYNTQGNKPDGTSGGSASELTGKYTEAYRHQVGYTYSSPAKLVSKNMKLENGNVVTCETCHVAHGTDSQYWQDTLTKANGGSLPTGITAADLTEVAGSSAMKRLPNMGVCETCHAKGAGNQGYSPKVTPVGNSSQSGPGGGYVGQDACSSCHADYFEHFQNTWHPQKTRPGVTDAVAEEVAPNTAAINAIVPALSDAITSTQAEVNKVGAREDISNAANWAGKNVDPSKITVWSWGKDSSRIAVRGSYLTAKNVAGGPYAADKWYLVAGYDEGTKQFSTQISGGKFGEYNCFNNCHTTGYDKTQPGYVGNSSDLTTLWLNKVAAGQKPAFDLGVTCEACHGQGGNHVKAPSANNIVNPVKQDITLQTSGTAAKDANGNAILVMNTTSLAKACGSCHSGASHQGDFYSTGSYNSHGASAPYNANAASPMNTYTPSQHYIQGLLTCNNCHDSHNKTAIGNQLRLKADSSIYNIGTQLCGTCHSNIKTLADIEYYMPIAGSEEGFGIDASGGMRKHGAALNVPQHDPANGK